MKEARDDTKTADEVTLRSQIGLMLLIFFWLNWPAGIILPFLSKYVFKKLRFLKQHGWGYDTIGIVNAIGGLGTFLMQIPAGILSDHIKKAQHQKKIEGYIYPNSIEIIHCG